MAVLRPADETELADMVRACLADRVPLELVGGGTKRAVGRPVEATHVLDLSGLTGIVSYEPEELVLVARAGTPLAEIESALEDRGQHLAFDPPDVGAVLPHGGGQTIGGVVAANSAGPRRLSAGAVRDHLLGFRAVNGRGEAFKSGGRVVKNVTGYDLSKLVTGSWGTLAALTEVALKVLPRAEDTATLVLRGLDPVRAGAAMRTALGSPAEVAAAAWQDGIGTLIRLDGPAPSVDARKRALTTLLAGFGPAHWLDRVASHDLWRRIGDVRALGARPDDIVWKISVPPAAGPGLVTSLDPPRSLLDWAGGLVWLAMPEGGDGGTAAVRDAVARSGGHATLYRAPEALRAASDPFEPPDGALLGLVRRVKESFDPLGLFNRGRMYREI